MAVCHVTYISNVVAYEERIQRISSEPSTLDKQSRLPGLVRRKRRACHRVRQPYE